MIFAAATYVFVGLLSPVRGVLAGVERQVAVLVELGNWDLDPDLGHQQGIVGGQGGGFPGVLGLARSNTVRPTLVCSRMT